jgi:hypothetical protein
MEKKYTAEDLYIAFLTSKYFLEPQAGTKIESWERNVRKGWVAVIEENRQANRGMTTEQFEQHFDNAKASVQSGSPLERPSKEIGN